MFTYLSNLVWGAQEETDTSETLEVEHSAHEEAGEWIVITTAADQPEEQSKSDATSQESECDLESACSDGSWTITPAPTFRVTGNHVHTDTTHPLENLLIEHPTMSVYGGVPEEEEGTRDEEEDDRKSEIDREQERTRAQAQEVVRLRNRQRYQVAVQLQLPMQNNQNNCAEQLAKTMKTPLRVTRRGAQRHNQTKQKTARGKQNLHIKKCSFVAGRRRC